MFDRNWDADQTVYTVLVAALIAAIALFLIRAVRRKGDKPWPAFFAGLYNILLLLLFQFGMLTQVGWEGFGFFPLLVLTLPWSWLLWWLFDKTGIFDLSIWGSGLEGSFLFIFITCNVLGAAANSCILYFLLKRRQKKHAEDEAWERARRSR